jgi:hypothetical protein
LQTRHWSQLLNENAAADFIKLTTAFIIVRLGKGMAMSMVLLTFTLQFNHLEPSYGYVALTLLYFILSQYKGTYFYIFTVNAWLVIVRPETVKIMQRVFTGYLTFTIDAL